MFWSGWVKDCKGGGLGRGWAGGWWCGYRHRSAKGATSESRKPRTPPPFQSTLPRRERRKRRFLSGVFADFNPRSREGSDLRHDVCSAAPHPFQSTLPRRERLRVLTGLRQARRYFNPRSREGSDPSQKLIITQLTVFQSTLPRRERRSPSTISESQSDFNPRSREGSDGIIAILRSHD